MNNESKLIQIPASVYQKVVSHLKVHAKENKEAANCLQQLSSFALRVNQHKLPTGTYILNNERSVKYE